MAQAFRVENLLVYQRLCDLHLEACDLTHRWPSEERYELASQTRAINPHCERRSRKQCQKKRLRSGRGLLEWPRAPG